MLTAMKVSTIPRISKLREHNNKPPFRGFVVFTVVSGEDPLPVTDYWRRRNGDLARRRRERGKTSHEIHKA